MKKTLSQSQLNTLLDSMRLINSTLDLDELLEIIMKEITDNLEADRGTLYIVDHQKKEIWSKIAQGDKKLVIRQKIGKGISGHVAKTGKSLNIKDAYSDPRFNPEVDKKSGYRTRSILCVPVFDKVNQVIAVLQILNKTNGHFTAEDLTFTAVFADYISLAIQNAQLYQEALERKRLENEIAVASEIQKMLLPAHLPQLNNYEIFAFQQPSRYIGGDYYDFFPEGEELFFILADVAGKGTPAALLMANLQAAFHNLVGKNRNNIELISLINKHLYSVTPPDKYATLVWGELNTADHELNYVIAGHLPPLRFTPDGKLTKVTELSPSSIPVGLLPQFDFQQGSVHLAPSELVLFCSDGITEAQNRKDEMFETSRLIRIVKRNMNKPIDHIGNIILRKVREFTEGGVYEDDITLLMIRRKSDLHLP